jgi:hypothetical protein
VTRQLLSVGRTDGASYTRSIFTALTLCLREETFFEDIAAMLPEQIGVDGKEQQVRLLRGWWQFRAYAFAAVLDRALWDPPRECEP